MRLVASSVSSSAPAAYLVLAQLVKGTRAIVLVDWAFVSPEAMTELLSAAVELAGSSTVMTWLATLPDDERVMLRRSGFVEHSTPAVERHRPGLLVQSLEGANARVSVAPRRERPTWSYRPVDGDNF